MQGTLTTSPSPTEANADNRTEHVQKGLKVLRLNFETFISILGEMDQGHLYDLQLYILLVALAQEFQGHDDFNQWERDQKLHRISLPLYPPGSPLFYSMLYNFGSIITTRLLRLGESAEADEVDEAILVLPQILSFPTLDIPKRLDRTIVLAKCLKARFTRLERQDDLDDAAKYFKAVIQMCPSSQDYERAIAHLDLAVLLQHYNKDTPDFEPIFDNLRKSHRLLPPGDYKRIEAALLLYRFLNIYSFKSGDTTIIEESTQLQIEVVSNYPPSHPSRLTLLLECGRYFFVCYTQQRTLSHLNLSYDYLSEALTLTPPDQSDERIDILTNLVSISRARFEEMGKKEDLEYGVQCARDALELCPSGSSLHSVCLGAISSILYLRYSELGNLQDLRDAAGYIQANNDLQPQENVDPHPFINLAEALDQRFSPQSGGDSSEIEEAIGYSREAVKIARSSAHEALPAASNALAKSLLNHFQQMGNTTDLDEAITLLRDLNRTAQPVENQNVTSLQILSLALTFRYQALRDIGDIKESNQYLGQALRLVSPTDPIYPGILNSLAFLRQAVASTRRDGAADVLDDTVGLHREALGLSPNSSSMRQIHLCNLGWALLTRFNSLRNTRDLNQAIKYLREATEFPTPSASLYVLGCALVERAGLRNSSSQMEEAIEILHRAESLVQEGHPYQAYIAHVLAQAYDRRSDFLMQADDFDKAMYHLERACNQPSIGLGDQFVYTAYWALKSHMKRHKSSLRAYSTYLFLLERLVMLSNTVEGQQQLLTKSYQFLPSCAASCAIGEGQVETAVEFLEQGRAILWTQVGRYRSSLDRLSAASPNLAEEFRNLSLQLEKSVVAPPDLSNREATAYRQQSSQWNVLLEKIRTLEGFSNFLKPIPFADLQRAALHGPVVIINIDHSQSCAIIVQHTSSPVSITLPKATESNITDLSADLASALALDGDDFRIARSARVVRVLRRLWDAIVQPIVSELRGKYDLPEGSRIWWCPTSSLWSLPLHAAGPYRAGEKNLPDIFVSSYTSTLSALLRSTDRPSSSAIQPSLKVLLVGQVESPGRAPLANVLEETRQVCEFAGLTTILEGEHATCNAVIAGLQECSWVHFACHGKQDLARPFNSHFILHDKPLHLLDIIQKGLPNAEFAFLSACHSAAGDKNTPNESIHLASGLQFSGFGGVVGTMWGMVDDDGPVMAKEFYKFMFRNPEAPDFRDAAVALNLATRVLRRMGVPVERWIHFIHIGA